MVLIGEKCSAQARAGNGCCLNRQCLDTDVKIITSAVGFCSVSLRRIDCTARQFVSKGRRGSPPSMSPSTCRGCSEEVIRHWRLGWRSSWRMVKWTSRAQTVTGYGGPSALVISEYTHVLTEGCAAEDMLTNRVLGVQRFP